MTKNNKISVLIVDDEKRFRETTSKILQKRGFDVKAVAGGKEAIEAVHKGGINVVILDVKMPEMDGNEALQNIKEIAPGVEVIMLTGHGTPESAAKGLRDGVFDYLTKPCDVDILSRKIREAHEKEKGVSERERGVKDIMLPLSAFGTINQEQTAQEAINEILKSFIVTPHTPSVHETIHRSILVNDTKGRVVGLISFTDLLMGMQPPYMSLKKERPELAYTFNIESPAHSGMFTILVRDLAQKKVKDMMSEAPPTIDAEATLMEAVNKLLTLNVRRLLVMKGGDAVGVIREQDIFFEMAHILGIYERESLM